MLGTNSVCNFHGDHDAYADAVYRKWQLLFNILLFFFNKNIENIVRSFKSEDAIFSTQLHVALLSNVITLSHNCSLCKKKTATEVNIFCFADSPFF